MISDFPHLQLPQDIKQVTPCWQQRAATPNPLLKQSLAPLVRDLVLFFESIVYVVGKLEHLRQAQVL